MPEKYCLESNFLINLLGGKDNAVQAYQTIKGSPLSISSVTLFEILRGEEKNQTKIQAFNDLAKKLDVLPFGEQEAKEAGEVEKNLKNKGIQVGIPDLFIAITAKLSNAVLITNDNAYKNFIGLRVMNY